MVTRASCRRSTPIIEATSESTPMDAEREAVPGPAEPQRGREPRGRAATTIVMSAMLVIRTSPTSQTW